MRPVGGGNAVTVWTLQALRGDYDVTLATLDPVNCAALNRSFGTSLSASDFHVRIAPPAYRRVLRIVPTRGALVELNLTMRWARELDRLQPFDVLLSLQNEADFGRPAIQYIHFPSWYMPRPADELRWFHKIPGVLRAYRRVAFGISGAIPAAIRHNLSLTNSAFVDGRFHQVHDGPSIIVHPPVPGSFPEIPWERRRDAIVGIGRLARYKRWGMAVEIVEALRRRGYGLELTLIGQAGDAGERAEKCRLEALAAKRPWFRILIDLTREQLAQEVANHRYGIHAMVEEHFGIAVAELQQAGCVTFVQNSGGPVEIVGNDPRLTFDDVEDGVGKIARALNCGDTQRELRALAASRRECFSTERFCRSMTNAVDNFAHGRVVSG